MGLYINDIEFPKDGEILCINIYPDGKVCINMDLKCKKIATAVPVPPHGRLKDADAAIEDIRGEILEYQMNGMKGTPFYIEDLRTMWQRLADEELVPTVIPASWE